MSDFFRLTLTATRGKDRSVKAVLRDLDDKPERPPQNELQAQQAQEQMTLRQRLEGNFDG